MATLKLKRLLGKDRAVNAALGDLLAVLGTPVFVQDVDGTLLLGEALDPGGTRVAVEAEGDIVGWVGGGQPQAGIVAGMLTDMVVREAEKRALGRDLLDRYRELNLLYNLSEHLISSPEPQAIAEMALQEAGRLIQAGAAWLLLVDEGGEEAQVLGHSGAPLAFREGGARLDIVDDVLASREGQIRNDVLAHRYFDNSPQSSCALLCAPLKTEQRVLGVILLAAPAPAAYTARDLKLLNTVALQAGPALEMARLYQIAVVQGRMERELQMAYQVQSSLIPRRSPQMEGWDFAGRWTPARELSGDYYDFIPEPDGRLGLVIGDVADKGIPSALFMVFTRSAVRAAVEVRPGPARAIAQANRLVAQESTNGLFVTLIYARLEQKSGLVTFINAGHNPALHFCAATGELLELGLGGLPLGIMRETPYAERDLQMKPGDLLVFYTDGVTEAMDDAQEEFGLGRLRQTILRHVHLPAEVLASTIEEAVREFTGPGPLFDDFTLMIARRLPA